MNKRLIFGGVLAATSVMAASAFAYLQPPADMAAGKTLFEQRCADCHSGDDERAPSPADLKQHTNESIIDALTNGAMKPMAGGLSADQIKQIAVFLTEKPLASAAPAAPAPSATPAPAAAARPQSGAPAAGVAAYGAAAPASNQPADRMCETQPAIVAKPTDWNGFGKDTQGSRRQTNTTITPGNVERLKVKWSFAMAGGRYGQPTVIGDWLFVATGAGQTFALDANTGCVHWRKTLGSTSRTSPIVEKRGESWIVYVGDRNRDVYALDAMTGKELWKTNVETHPRALLTGSPVLYNDTLYVPTSSSEETIATVADYSCCTFIGAVTAIDVRTGKIIWKTPMIEGNKPTRKNTAGTQMFGPAGAAIWSQPTIDAKRNLVYVATGDSYTEAEAPRSDAIVALDMATGKIKWHNQVTANDNFLTACNPARRGINCPLGEIGPDHDYGASPILFTLPGGKQVILSGQKSSVVYGMDADTGKTLWETKLGAGGALGGVEWGMAIDNSRLYVSNSDVTAPRERGGNPSVTAINPANGERIWQVQAPKVPCSFVAARCSNAQSAPPTVIPGVVFAGGHDGWLRAYASGTGRTLWMFDSAGRTYQTTNGVANQPGGSFDATGPVVSGGRMYAISGYTGATGAFGNPLNVLLAFTVDGQ